MSSTTKGLDLGTLQALLANDKTTTGGYPPPVQHGPLRFHDKSATCASKRCGCSTYLTVKGVPYCSMHTLRKLNEMLIELGVES